MPNDNHHAQHIRMHRFAIFAIAALLVVALACVGTAVAEASSASAPISRTYVKCPTQCHGHVLHTCRRHGRCRGHHVVPRRANGTPRPSPASTTASTAPVPAATPATPGDEPTPTEPAEGAEPDTTSTVRYATEAEAERAQDEL